MNVKKIGIWTGGFIGSFIVVLTLTYFLFPYLNPEKANEVEKEKPSSASVENASFDPSKYSLQAVDSLNQQITSLKNVIDSLEQSEIDKQQIIDSLRTELEAAYQSENKIAQTTPAEMENAAFPIKEATKPLLSLDEDALSPIVDLLEEHQLISLYREGSGRQREKLLRTLKPEKAARILKKVM